MRLFAGEEVESRDCTCLGRRVSGSPLETLETHWFDRLVSDVEIEPQLGEIDYCLLLAPHFRETRVCILTI